ncbi:MAG: hypothetical protein PHX34_02505 [Candidatus Shapirobacteria bacterium]|nr:hypothetical protein [Candidatus Shapirobacteria bacterium]
MPKEIYLSGRCITLNPKQIIGSGGEADIYRIDPNHAVKIYKTPDHPDYKGLPKEQEGARERILIHQRKLREFPKNLPSRIITPIDLATDANNQKILGYEMLLVKNSEVLMRYSERNFRASVPNEAVIVIFCDLHSTVEQTHKAGVVLGDFNDLNVLISGTEAYIIDADSCQWGSYPCRVYTTKFVDPLLCNSSGMVSQHNENSDWYAFSVMLFQSLLFVDPYGGIYKPKNPAQKIPQSSRQLHRITVFNLDVVYPKPAIPYGVLPDDLLEYFHRLFEKDIRGIFPIKTLENMRWTQCTNCGLVHARGKCPGCDQIAPGSIKERQVVQVTGKRIIATRVFQTSGRILFAAYQGGRLRYLYQNHGEDCFRREDGSIVVSGRVCTPQMRFRINGSNTIIATQNRMTIYSPNEKPVETQVDSFGSLPMFDANERHYYWVRSGDILRNGTYGNELIGQSLENQTLFWVGPRFGFGFYQAGELSMYYTFDAEKSQSLNDKVNLPRISGQLIDSTCVFAEDRCWFFTSTQQGGKTINQCSVIMFNGVVLGTTSTTAGDGSWLGSIRGKLAAGNFLLSNTDDGIVKVQTNGNGQIEKIQEFPDTEPFVSSTDHLFFGDNGLSVVHPKEVWNLRIV